MEPTTSLAFIDAGTLALLVPIVALLIPIIAVLTKHQQKMAEILRGGQANELLAHELEQVKREVRDLREIVHQQAIALDDAATMRKTMAQPPLHPEDLRNRLGS